MPEGSRGVTCTPPRRTSLRHPSRIGIGEKGRVSRLLPQRRKRGVISQKQTGINDQAHFSLASRALAAGVTSKAADRVDRGMAKSLPGDL